MATGQFYKNPIFNFDLNWTKRRVTAVTSKTNTIVITTVSAMETVSVGDWIKVEDCAAWANGIYQVISKGVTTLNLKKPGLAGGRSYTPTLDSKVWKVTSGGADVPETRKLSSMFTYNTDLTATSKLCARQVRVKDTLNQFYGNAEVEREYRCKRTNYGTYWVNGYTGGFNKADIVNNFMCTVWAESQWKSGCIGVSGVCQQYGTVSNPLSYPLGLWQITDAHSTAAWWPSSASALANNGTLLNAEYNTRAALWLMWKALFFVDPIAHPERSTPFYPWHSTDPSSNAYDNYKGCMKAFPPYGTNNC